MIVKVRAKNAVSSSLGAKDIENIDYNSANFVSLKQVGVFLFTLSQRLGLSSKLSKLCLINHYYENVAVYFAYCTKYTYL